MNTMLHELPSSFEMSDISENLSLPPGWDTKYDFRTGRKYYINYITRITSLEDPRLKYKKFQNGDSFTLQSYQSSPIRTYSPQPFYHMHQDINFSSGRPSPIMGRSYSPLMGSNVIHYLAQKPHEYPTVESSVAKIKALFPTVSETHIKTLLHKYHYREAVVMSALQVEKHPLMTPGPYSSSPLSVAKHVIGQIAPSAPASPGRLSFSSALRSLSPRKTPHGSPKMKLRYLKSQFPVVDETVLLDTLCRSENNVHKASEELLLMGFSKKGDYSSKLVKKPYETAPTIEKELKPDSVFIPLRDPSPNLKSYEDKTKIKKKLQDKFVNVAERIVTLALETANYDEERAEQFLNSTDVEEKKLEIDGNMTLRRESTTNIGDVVNDDDSSEKPFRDSGIWEKISPDTSENKSSVNLSSCLTDESIETRNISDLETPVTIPTPSPMLEEPTHENDTAKVEKSFLSKTGYKLCQKIIPKGPNKSLLLGSRCVPKGPNQGLAKGPCKGLAKGSVFSVKKHFTNTSRENEIQRKSECVIF